MVEEKKWADIPLFGNWGERRTKDVGTGILEVGALLAVAGLALGSSSPPPPLPKPTLLINGSAGPINNLPPASSVTASGTSGLPNNPNVPLAVWLGDSTNIIGTITANLDGMFSGSVPVIFGSAQTIEIGVTNLFTQEQSNQVTLNEFVAPQEGTLSLSDTSVYTNASLTASGSNYPPGVGTIKAVQNSATTYNVPFTADSTGHFSGIVMPTLDAGSYSVTSSPAASNQPLDYTVTSQTLNLYTTWLAARIRPIDDQVPHPAKYDVGWAPLIKNGASKDYSPNDIVSMVIDFHPDELNRYFSGYLLDSSGNDISTTVTLAELGAVDSSGNPLAGAGSTPLEFAQSCLEQTRSYGVANANQNILMYPRLTFGLLHDYYDKKSTAAQKAASLAKFTAAVQNLAKFGKALSPPQLAIAFDNETDIPTYQDALFVIGIARKAGFKYVCFGACGDRFSGSWKKGDVDIVMSCVDASKWTSNAKSVAYWNKLGGLVERPLAQIDAPCQVADLLNEKIPKGNSLCKNGAGNQNNSVQKIHSIITGLASSQKSGNYHFMYPLLQVSQPGRGIDVNDSKWTTPDGTTLYQHEKDLAAQYNDPSKTPPTQSYDLQALMNHVNNTYDSTVELWSTSARTGVNGSGGCFGGSVKGVPEDKMFWISSENVITLLGMYELGNSTQAVNALKKILSFNPFHMSYREEILGGMLLPVGQQGNAAGCQFFEKGTLTSGVYSYAVMNNTSPGLSSVSTKGLGANGELACQILNDWIRGGTNYQTWLNALYSDWDGTGFASSKVNGAYQTRALGLAGCALLVCGDPKNLMPTLQAAAATLQASDGSFPNSYTTLRAGAPGGDAESYNRILLWNAPKWLAWMQSLKGTATQSTPYPTQYTPPGYIST